MSRAPRRGNGQGRRPAQKRPAAIDVWSKPGPLPDFEPIAVPSEAGALLRSLGDPPLLKASAATRHFTIVIQRAAVIAAALALSADLLAKDDEG